MNDADSMTLPLTAAQYGIWLGQQLDPASPAYWTAEAIELQGELDVNVFEDVLKQVVTACQALHMRYQGDGAEVLQRCHYAPDWVLQMLDFSHLPCPLQAWHAWTRTDLVRTVDLAVGPLFGSALIRLGRRRYIWHLRVHHIALDGFGYALLMDQVATLYAARCRGQAPLCGPFHQPLSLPPVIREDLAYRASRAWKHDRHFWREKLNSAAAPPMLAPPTPVAHGIVRRRGTVAAADFMAWRHAAEKIGVDWGVFLMAGTAVWLHRLTAATDITLGLPVMCRLGSVTLNVPCMTMNIVPLRLTVLPGQSFATVARTAAQELSMLRPHQRYRYEQLKQDLGLSGSGRRLFGPVLNIMQFDRRLHFGDVAAVGHRVAAGPVEDLAITFAPGLDLAADVRFDLEANPDAYDEEALASHQASLAQLLSAAAKAPTMAVSSLPGSPLAATRIAAVLRAQPLTQQPLPVLQALLAHAARSPDHPALEQEGQATLTYGQLLMRVQALAGQMTAHQAGPGSLVALLLPRSPDAVIALLAVLWAGAAYVPIDPEGPQARLNMLLNDVKPVLVLSLEAYKKQLTGSTPVLFLDQHTHSAASTCIVAPPSPLPKPVAVGAEALAYVIYTSGSTGLPNGVQIGRAALAHFVAAATQRYGITHTDRILQFAPLHFDASVEEIFLALCNGASLILRTATMLDSMHHFCDACATRGITVLDLPTTFWHELAYAVGNGTTRLPPALRLTIIGGEAALAERVARWRATTPSHMKLFNTYGPTEATVIFTVAQLAGPGTPDDQDQSAPVSIGTPLAGLTVAVVDSDLRTVAVGTAGELCLIGPTLAHGYLARDAITATRFIPLPDFPDAGCAYRTGDRVQLGADGVLRYLGRLDDEFKLSGYRIDPAEVESTLLGYPGIREAAVVGQSLPDGGKRLAAFLVAVNMPQLAALRCWLTERLPAPAVPAAFSLIARLPRNANGKIHRGALRNRPVAEQCCGEQLATPLELAVMSVWRAVLGVSDLTPESDFFLLGGKSLQAIQVANRLSHALQREVPVSALFRHSSVASLAQSLDTPLGHQPPVAAKDPFSPLLTLQAGSGPGLFCIHPAEGLAWCYWGLAAQLPQMPIYGLQAKGLTAVQPASIDELVADYLALIRAVQPHGPYLLLGWSSGGGIAQALATALQRDGAQVALLAMMDSYPADVWSGKPPAQERDALVALLDVIGDSDVTPDGQPLSNAEIRARLQRPGSTLATFSEQHLEQLVAMALHSMALYRHLRHQRFDGDLLFFRAARRSSQAPDWRDWEKYTNGGIDCVDIDSSHGGMSQRLPLTHIGRVLADYIARLEGVSSAAQSTPV